MRTITHSGSERVNQGRGDSLPMRRKVALIAVRFFGNHANTNSDLSTASPGAVPVTILTKQQRRVAARALLYLLESDEKLTRSDAEAARNALDNLSSTFDAATLSHKLLQQIHADAINSPRQVMQLNMRALSALLRRIKESAPSRR